MTHVHGDDAGEAQRLQDQAASLVELLHADTAYPARDRVLEAGCGVGAQTVTLARRSPQARFTCVDLSCESLAQARAAVHAAGAANIEFMQADVFRLPFAPHSFDHVFFTAMVQGVRASAIASQLATAAEFDRGVADLERTAAGGGVFRYTFFKAVAAGQGDGA